MSLAVANIHPQQIVDAFGNYRIGIAEALKGDGHADDGRFQDIVTDWAREPTPVLQAAYLRRLVREATRGQYNFIEFWGWPEIRYRADDGKGMVYSRVRLLYVQVVMNTAGRPN